MSNIASENNIPGNIPIPGYDTLTPSGTIVANSGRTDAGGTLTTSVTGGCATHKVASNINKFSQLNNVNTNQKIWAKEINSLKWAIKNVGDFWNQAGNGRIINTVPSFTSKTTGSKILASEWNEIKTTLAAFTGVSGVSSLIYRSTTDKISASFHNELNMVYNNIRATCRCNSDCGCNMVCACNYDCGCNYSDRRLKENIAPITGGTTSELIYNLNTYSYNYKDTDYRLPGSLQYGVMAQDLIELGYEEFINEDDKGFYQVNYTMMIPLMINELQKHKQSNEKLEIRLTNLEGLVQAMYNNYKSH